MLMRTYRLRQIPQNQRLSRPALPWRPVRRDNTLPRLFVGLQDQDKKTPSDG
jgi:hypothetical protein